eukprot:4148748-Pyramimonas_sp.AAC.1
MNSAIASQKAGGYSLDVAWSLVLLTLAPCFHPVHASLSELARLDERGPNFVRGACEPEAARERDAPLLDAPMHTRAADNE